MGFYENKLNLRRPADRKFFLKLVFQVIGIFFLCYTVPNKLAYIKPERVFQLYTQWELKIPLIPEFIFIYVSTYIQILIPVFFLTKRRLYYYAWAINYSSIVAAFFFIFLPGELGFDRTQEVARYAFMYKWLHMVDDPHNMYPSLHVAYSTITTLTIFHHLKSFWAKRILAFWQVLVYLSIFFVHQHHLFDLITGLPLAIYCYNWSVRKSEESEYTKEVPLLRKAS